MIQSALRASKSSEAKETHQAAPVRMENLDGTKVSLPIIIEVRKITQKVMTLRRKKKFITDNKHKYFTL